MRRRFFALGYVFFALLTVTGLIMAISFFARISSKPVRLQPDLIQNALSDSAAIQADPAYVVEYMGQDFQASLKNFHYYPKMAFVDAAYRSNCLSCHLPLPHNKNIRLRSFLNMHGDFIACQTCHGREPADHFEWLDIQRGQPVNMHPSNLPLMAVQLVGVTDEQIGFTGSNDTRFQQMVTAAGAGQQQQDELCRKYFRGQKNQALGCLDCHTDKQAAVDWQALGYAPEQVARLSSLSIPAVFLKYGNFYLPMF